MTTTPRQLVELNVSLETYNEVLNALDVKGVKINSDANITLNKDIRLKGPLDYRLVQIRRDVLMEVVKVYKTPMNDSELEVSNSKHFIDFLDAVFQYVLKGKEAPATTKSNEWK